MKANKNHWTERGRAASVSNSDAIVRPRRSVPISIVSFMEACAIVKKRRYALGCILLAAFSIVLVTLRSPATKPLEIVSSGTNIHVSVSYTFGTRHEYFFGNPGRKFVDILLSRFTSRSQHAIGWSTNVPSSVIWVCSSDPAINPNRPRLSPADLFEGEFTDPAGHVSALMPLRSALVSYRHGLFVTGWPLPGDLSAYQHSRLRITSANGSEVVTIRIR